jgi:hypothetical protein
MAKGTIDIAIKETGSDGREEVTGDKNLEEDGAAFLRNVGLPSEVTSYPRRTVF